MVQLCDSLRLCRSAASSGEPSPLSLNVQVEFLGRVQKQEQDDAWYTCINYISVCGKPLYGFVPAQPGQEPSGHAPHQGKPQGLLLRKVHAVEAMMLVIMIGEKCTVLI